jgi:hypothetical protein
VSAHELLDERRGGPLIPDGAPPAFHLPAKPTGAICNLELPVLLAVSV